MIIFNTTYHIDDDIHMECLKFLKEFYIPTAVDSGFVHTPQLAKIYAQYEESGGSYSLQFKAKNIETLQHWLSTHGKALQKEMTIRFGEKALGFSTILEEIGIE